MNGKRFPFLLLFFIVVAAPVVDHDVEYYRLIVEDFSSLEGIERAPVFACLSANRMDKH